MLLSHSLAEFSPTTICATCVPEYIVHPTATAEKFNFIGVLLYYFL